MGRLPTVDLTPTEAAEYLLQELAEAGDAFRSGTWDLAVDGSVRALGLALQLGPKPTERALTSILHDVRGLDPEERPKTLATLGPALVALVLQVQEAGALPPGRVMEAWALLSSDVGALVGEVGLALTLPPDRCSGLMSNARRHAVLLDDASGGALGLAAWLDAISLDPPSPVS